MAHGCSDLNKGARQASQVMKRPTVHSSSLRTCIQPALSVLASKKFEGHDEMRLKPTSLFNYSVDSYRTRSRPPSLRLGVGGIDELKWFAAAPSRPQAISSSVI